MQKFLTLLITAAILYMIMQHKADSWETPKSREVEAGKNTDKKTTSDEKEVIDFQGNFIEKTLSKVVLIHVTTMSNNIGHKS